jgi:peptidoglycan/xylan/chitin deacetylase (PgdA/CDA1 family)
MKADIAAAQASLSDITGQAPGFFRPTAGLRNPFLDPVLAALDLRLAAWSRRGYDTREGRPDIVLGRLTRGLGAGDILLMHDGHSALTPEGQPVILAILPPLLRALAEQELKPVTLDDATA